MEKALAVMLVSLFLSINCFAAEIQIEKQEVTDDHPLQYKFTTYKTVKDIKGEDVQIEDKVEITNTLELDVEKETLNKQIVDLQIQIKTIDDKLQKIVLLSK